MEQKKLFIIVGVLIAIIGTWFYLSNGEILKQSNSEETSDTVALVNGKSVSRNDLKKFEEQVAAGQMVDLDSLDDESREQFEKEVLDMLVSNVLIQQAAKELGIEATESDIDIQLEAIKSRFQDDAQYQEALLAEGMSESDLRFQIAESIISQEYFEQELDFDSIAATEEEINALYDQEVAATGEMPPLSEIYSQIELFIIQQKQQELFEEHIQKLRMDADVEILI
jgi:hypothetical protein